MTKPELGTKRICAGCGAKFYDLHKTPIVCPTCEAVFVLPKDGSNFIKRVIGLPGDQVVYQDKKITVNGVPLAQTADGSYGYLEGL